MSLARQLAESTARFAERHFDTATLRRDKTGAVETVRAFVNDDGSAWMQGPAPRPYEGDVLVQNGQSRVITEVSGWGATGQWRVSTGDAQPSAPLLPAPAITVRRMGNLIRVDFPDALTGDVGTAQAFTADGQPASDEQSTTFTLADKQVVLPGLSASWQTVQAWFTRPPMYDVSERARMGVPAA